MSKSELKRTNIQKGKGMTDLERFEEKYGILTYQSTESLYTLQEVVEKIMALHKNVAIVIGHKTVLGSTDEVLDILGGKYETTEI